MIVGVTNTVLSNSGDAAILKGIHEAITAELSESVEVRFIAFDSKASVTRRLYPDWKIHQQLTTSPPFRPFRFWFRWEKTRIAALNYLLNISDKASFDWTRLVFGIGKSREAFEAFKSCDVLVSSGGTYLVDHYFVGHRALEVRLAASLGKPVVLWTQSMGPFKKEETAIAARSIASKIDQVYFRDQRSADAWRSRVSDDPAGEVVPDAAFALTAPASQENPLPAKCGRAIISVRQWSRGVDQETFDSASYSSMMRAAAADLLEHGWSVEALSTCQGVPEYGFDDSAVAKDIFDGLNVGINEDFHTPNDLLGELKDVDLVITTRMHLAILAIVSRKPVIAVAYEFKTIELFQGLGLGDFVRSIESSSDSWIREKIDQIREDPASATLTEEQLYELRTQASSPATRLLDLVEARP